MHTDYRTPLTRFNFEHISRPCFQYVLKINSIFSKKKSVHKNVSTCRLSAVAVLGLGQVGHGLPTPTTGLYPLKILAYPGT